MKKSFPLKWVVFSLFIFSALLSTSVLADRPLITASFSGIWDQPEQESQGIILQIGERLDENGDSKKVGIAYWFTYGPDLKTSWYLGVGDVIGNEIDMVMYTGSDIGFMAANLEGDENVVPVGALFLNFRNCNQGTAAFEFMEDEQVIESGEFPIKRLTSIYRQRCSGGISDDTPVDGKPLQLEVRLRPVTEDGEGEGKAKFWERSDRSDFKVEVEGLLDGLYTVEICANHEDPDILPVQFEMEVVEGEGGLEFRSPEIDDKLLLNFDPRGCRIEVLSGDVVVLSSGDNVLAEHEPGSAGDGGDGDSVDKIEIEADFTSTDVIAGAKGGAELEIESDASEFSVKIKDVPAGLYALHINGVDHGNIEVVEGDKGTEGKVKLTNPHQEGTLELLVDPRGQVVEVRQNAVEDAPVILEVLFPSE